jgi:cardiolipin synthase
MAKDPGKKEKFFQHNHVRLIYSGPPFFTAVIRLLEEAKEEIHFQTYIFEEDETGQRMANELIRAAQRGVKVYLLADAYGSKNFSDETRQRLQAGGVTVRLFRPLLSRGKIHFGRRLHQKIIVCDQRKAIVAGVNISNNYSGVKDRHPWLDFAVLVEGDVIPSILHVCERTWRGFSMKNLRRRFEKSLQKLAANPSYQVPVKTLENDGLRGRYQCATSYLRLIHSAKDSIVIVGGYFLPGGRARRALKKAIIRGVRIRVILAAKSDVGLMHRGMQYLYAWLLRNRIEIYEYKPANVHGKVIVSDKKFISIGSYDLNNLSTYSNIEFNLEIMSEPFAVELQTGLEKIIDNQCHPVTMTELENRFSLLQRLRLWYSYRMVKIMFVLAVWLANKENEQQ